MSQRKRHLVELCLFSMFGALMFLSDILMDILPNVHLLGMFVVVFTAVFRSKALIPIYLYVFLIGVKDGFGIWWLGYLYVWTVLWGMTILLPKNMKQGVASIVYPFVCGFHGLIFGILYAPVDALAWGFDFEQTVAWVIAGSTWDIRHAVGNLLAGLLILPLVTVLNKLLKKSNLA